MECYIASGWFNEQQANDLKVIKNALEENNVKYFSPKDANLISPTSNEEEKQNGFFVNLQEIKKSKFLVANTRDKDMGTIFECGFAHCCDIPIIYYCEGLKGGFNLMLSQSGIAVATTPEELSEHIAAYIKDNTYNKQYVGCIE